MLNKILGIIIITLSAAAGIFGIILIPSSLEYGWTIIFTSLFMILVGIIVYRKGIKAVIRSVDDATPKDIN